MWHLQIRTLKLFISADMRHHSFTANMTPTERKTRGQWGKETTERNETRLQLVFICDDVKHSEPSVYMVYYVCIPLMICFNK